MTFPQSTELVRKIPKQRFYDNASVSSSVKKKFTDWIDSITISHKLSQETLHIKKTKEVDEIFIFQVKLKDSSYINRIEDVLLVIDKYIPYHILYCIEGLVYKIAHKTKNQNNPNLAVVDVYMTANKEEIDLELDSVLQSLNMKVLYERLIQLFTKSSGDFEESVEQYKDKISLEKEILILENKLRKEKQADRQFVLHKELQSKKKELENIYK